MGSVSGVLLFYGVSNFSWANMHDILIFAGSWGQNDLGDE